MKYTGKVDIDCPLDKVASFFADPQYLKEYQEGFVQKRLVSGEEGKNGAVSKMYYKSDKREMELTETITANNLPHSFEAFYHHKHMDNTMKCSFQTLENGKTRYVTEVEYTRINWVMPRLMAILFPGMYKKHGERWMNNFKTFVEKEHKSSQSDSE